MINWAAWMPTIITAITCIFMAGVIWNTYGMTVREHTEHLKAHDKLHEEARQKNQDQDVALVRLEEYQKGFAAARSTYEPHK
jgi:predicted tellurium resistance membrane protein TerC